MSKAIEGGKDTPARKGFDLRGLLESVGTAFTKKFFFEQYARHLASELFHAAANNDEEKFQELREELSNVSRKKNIDDVLKTEIDERVKNWYVLEHNRDALERLIGLLSDKVTQEDYRVQIRERVAGFKAFEGLSDAEKHQVARQRLVDKVREVVESTNSASERERSIVAIVMQFMRTYLSFEDAVSTIETNVADVTRREEALVNVATMQLNRDLKTRLVSGYSYWEKTAATTLLEADWKKFETHMAKVGTSRAEMWWVFIASEQKLGYADLQRALSHISNETTKKELLRKNATRFAMSMDVTPGFSQELDQYASEFSEKEQDDLRAVAALFYFGSRYDQYEASFGWKNILEITLQKIHDPEKKDETSLRIIETFVGMRQYIRHNQRSMIERAREITELLIAGIKDSQKRNQAQEILDSKSKKKGIR